MKMMIRLISGAAFAALSFFALAASASGQEARILKIVGGPGATVVANGQSSPAAEQMSVPVSAVIVTTGQEVYLQVIPGVVASIQPNSRVVVDTLSGPAPELDLQDGSVVSEVDKTQVIGKAYSVKMPHGVAAARGTGFSASVTSGGFSIAATADAVTFTANDGTKVTIRAGAISITPPGATSPGSPIPLAQAAAANPAVAAIVRTAVQTAATVVQTNMGNMSGSTATGLLTQVVAVANAVLPNEATTFTSQAVTAVTASTSSTASDPATAAAAITAAAISGAPDRAAAIAGAAAAAVPASQTGVVGAVTAAAQQVAPNAKDAITTAVSASTGQSTSSVQSDANSAQSQAANGVNQANTATQNVIQQPAGGQPPSNPNPTPGGSSGGNTNGSNTSSGNNNTTPPVDPTVRSSSPST